MERERNVGARGLGAVDIVVLLLVLFVLWIAALFEFPGLDRKAARPAPAATPTAPDRS